MGLAASQARFLAITARKANCEFQSLQLAQQQLSLSRDMETISQEYQDALNQTQLVWDPDGSGTYMYNLSYNLMMSPSELNNNLPFMLGRRDGKIALNSSYAAAIESANAVLSANGLPLITESGFSGTEEQKFLAYQAFIGGLQTENIASADQGAYIPNAGLGGELYGRENGGSVSLTSMISYIDMLTEGVENGIYPSGTSYYNQGVTATFNFESFGLGTNWIGIKGSPKIGILQNGSYDNSKFNLADLLNEDITILTRDATNYNNIAETFRTVLKNSYDNGAFATLINNDVKTWYDSVNGAGKYEALSVSEKTILSFVDQLGKCMYSLLLPNPPSSTDLNAFYMAMDDILCRICTSTGGYADLDGGKRGVSESYGKNAVQNAENFNCWVKKGNMYALSLSNLTEAFLTNFVNGMDGYSGGYGIFNKVSDSYYVTDDPGYLYQINCGETTDETLYQAEFYSIIFNTICQNGWYENEYVDNKDYLDNAIKTGQLFVVSKGNDNYFYQDRYLSIYGGHIMENTDEDAIARAEREYTVKKAKINTKEEEIEIETRNLDAEISSLTTEYDTVKSLISKNIEKTFTLFNN